VCVCTKLHGHSQEVRAFFFLSRTSLFCPLIRVRGTERLFQRVCHSLRARLSLKIDMRELFEVASNFPFFLSPRPPLISHTHAHFVPLSLPLAHVRAFLTHRQVCGLKWSPQGSQVRWEWKRGSIYIYIYVYIYTYMSIYIHICMYTG